MELPLGVTVNMDMVFFQPMSLCLEFRRVYVLYVMDHKLVSS